MTETMHDFGDGASPHHAGMDPVVSRLRTERNRLPRTRGDGPSTSVLEFSTFLASPHTRGWTLPSLDWRRAGPGFPAHAGMDPRRWIGSQMRYGLPRTRGDGPAPGHHTPHTPQASPHTRGWTRGIEAAVFFYAGFPAHAGMDPGVCQCPDIGTWLPRTRGDGPASSTSRGKRVQGFPAHAGMDPLSRQAPPVARRLPRTRGDGPFAPSTRSSCRAASPHTRGWTRTSTWLPPHWTGFPAHAGMDLITSVCADSGRRLPRTRGDGPSTRQSRPTDVSASPHTRGMDPRPSQPRR